MKICVLASGSGGNSTFIHVNNKKILIDAGTTMTNIEKKLNSIDESISNIDYIFISHTHSDHTDALEVIIKKNKPYICLSNAMLNDLPFLNDYENLLIHDNDLAIDDIKIELIKTSHDVSDSRGFIISYDNKSLVYITDTGYINSRYFRKISNKNVYIFESNHDPEMLIKGKYPKWLQARVLSDVGHLSNEYASAYLAKLIGPNTKKVVLAHLSKENNNEEIALNKFLETMDNNNIDFKNVVIAKQNEISEVIELWLK